MKAFMALVAVAALLAGCGGSSGGGSSSGSSSGASSTSGSAAAASSSSTAGGGSTTGSTQASTSQPTFASTSNCQALYDMGKKYVSQLESTATGGQIDFANLLRADQAMADASPPAIHSDAEYVVHTFSNILGAMSKAGFKPGTVPTASQIAALLPLETQVKSAQFQAAANHISAWIHSNCHGVTP